MQLIPLTVPLLLLCSLGCRGATLDADSNRNSEPPSSASTQRSSPSDDQVVATIDDAIKKSSLLEPQSGAVQVFAADGVVTLQGQVGTAGAKERIHGLAQHTVGVTKVIDELQAPGPNPSAANDAAMTQAIQQHLAARQADKVSVTALDAKVTLEGSVLTEAEKAEIEKVAQHTPNVEVVDNRLLVRPLAKL
jgi:osmotically-inducible protein OsmY